MQTVSKKLSPNRMTTTIVGRDIIQNIVYFIRKSGQLIYFRLQLLKTAMIYRD